MHFPDVGRYGKAVMVAQGVLAPDEFLQHVEKYHYPKLTGVVIGAAPNCALLFEFDN